MMERISGHHSSSSSRSVGISRLSLSLHYLLVSDVEVRAAIAAIDVQSTRLVAPIAAPDHLQVAFRFGPGRVRPLAAARVVGPELALHTRGGHFHWYSPSPCSTRWRLIVPPVTGKITRSTVSSSFTFWTMAGDSSIGPERSFVLG